MPNRFVSLATRLREPASIAPEVPGDAPSADEEPVRAPSGAIDDCAMFRARLLEAFDRARATFIADLATEVLARELQLAPASIDAIAARIVADYSDEMPVRLRVSPGDRERVQVDLPIEVDPSLRSGDVVLVVRDGSLESTLGARLDAVVRAATRP